MTGTFKNSDACIKELRNQLFCFYAIANGLYYYYSKEKKEIAEINIYPDGSASAMIGKFNH